MPEGQNRVQRFSVDDGGKEIVQHNPLVVAADKLLDFFKARVRVFFDHEIVKPQHGRVQLRNDFVLVVARVTDNRPSRCGAPWNVAGVLVVVVAGKRIA